MFGRKKSTTPTATTAPATPAGTEPDDDDRSFMWRFGDLDDPAPGAWTTDPAITERTGR
ncbi:hypothetical protein [Streptomyces sp. NPDC001502]|uniref:hypothetical protein n=1 Tax=Streptomyces sp. NPDC001502 TaxID=3364578 RepID=UPI0036B98801